MTEPTPLRDFFRLCPRCDRPVEDHWMACPKCGLRLRRGDDLLVRSVAWMLVLTAFVLATLLIYSHDPGVAAWFGALFGLPLVYVFGKAVLFRVRGRPLTWKDLGWTSFRAALVSFGLAVVLPMIIGIALLILLFALCGAFLLSGRG